MALTAGAAIAAQLAAVAPAQAAGPAITIAATSRINPVPGYVLVEYRGGAGARARIHGIITGAAAGEVATLYAQPFPYAKAPAVVGSTAISAAGPAAYSFTVTPTLATRYQVELFAGQTATRPLDNNPQLEWLYLNAGHPSFTPARQVSADKFERTVTFSVTIGTHSSWTYAWLVCPQDTLSRDGLGLPGHHGCGSSRIRRTIGYLG